MSIKLTKEQNKILKSLDNGKCTMITGGAGVGKSVLIKAIRSHLSDEMHKVVFVTAMTGCAACIIDGSTLHSWAGIGLGDGTIEELFKKIMSRRGVKAKKKWQCCDVLLIDEVSMLKWDLFEKLNYLGKLIRKDTRPFGGIQVILVGDFFQLPPVCDSGEKKRFCFESDTWDDVVYNKFYMQTNMRQDNKDFQNVLDKIRIGECDKEVDKVLMKRFIETIKLKNSGGDGDSNKDIDVDGIVATKLYPIRSSVDYINSSKLIGLGEKIVKFNMTFKYKESTADEPFISRDKKEIKDFIDKNSQVALTVELSVGSQVMLLYNMDVDRKIVNGSRGVITKFDSTNGYPIVKFLDGKEYLIEPHEWNIKHAKGDVSYMQMPLKLAWAISQHKSQGMTLDLVEVDIGSSIFEFGQVYTALSRVKTLEGLFITDYDKRKIKCHPSVKKFYENLKVSKTTDSLEDFLEISTSEDEDEENPIV